MFILRVDEVLDGLGFREPSEGVVAVATILTKA